LGTLRALKSFLDESPFDFADDAAVKIGGVVGAQTIQQDLDPAADNLGQGLLLGGLIGTHFLSPWRTITVALRLSAISFQYKISRDMVAPDMKSRFTPILFDLDGTLVDSGKDIALATNRTLVRLGLETLPEEKIISFVGDGIRRFMAQTLSAHASLDIDAAVEDFRADYRENCLVHTVPFPGIMDLLRDLKNHPVGVVTNKPARFSKIILDGLGMSAYVDAMVGGDEAELKPNPNPLFLACERLGVEPGFGLMVGDFENDIQAGRAAGVKTCGVLWGLDRGEGIRKTGADFLCTTVSDLREVIFGT
jgi:2-phosphoglycolate phosphatase